jgi:FMN reductase
MLIPERNNFGTPTAKFRVAVVSGSWKSPSKTRVLTDAIILALQDLHEIELTQIDLAEVGTQVAALTDTRQADRHLSKLFSGVAEADLLVVGSPIFKGSYTGLFKHFFDLVDPRSLASTPVLLTATGGSLHYALALEHQFRPLFTFFRAHCLPTTVYAVEADFAAGVLVDQDVKDRIKRAALEAMTLIVGRRRLATALS